MDAELRLLLYAVVFGAGYSLYSIVRRKIARTLRFHAGVLVVLLAVSSAALLVPDWRDALAVPAIIGFTALALGPSLLILGGRHAARRRRFGIASGCLWTGAALLGLPASLLSESRLYAALAASERGDEDDTRRRLHALCDAGGLGGAHGGRTLADVLPLAGARRWEAALAVIDERPSAASAILTIETRAAAETGDLRRALRAYRVLAARGDAGASRLAALRGLLAVAGRVDLLTEARERGSDLMRGPRGAADLSIARANEARGDLSVARAHYTLAARGRGTIARDAASGMDRVDGGTPRVISLDEEELDELLQIEARERASFDGGGMRSGRATVTWVVTLVTLVVSALVFVLRGDDAFTLLAAGALSAPLVTIEGEWWRLFSAMLLHGGWLHLVLNLSCILVVGIVLERRLGPSRTLLVYLGAGFVGSLASVYINGTQIGVGASGGAMGLIGALLALLSRRPAMFAPLERRRWLSTLWGGVLATAAIGIAEADYVDNAAHAAGLIGGGLIALAALPDAKAGKTPARLARWRAAGIRMAAALLTGLALAAAVEAASEHSSWEGTQAVHAKGATVSLPGWLRVAARPDGSMVAQRSPAEIAILVGALPDIVPRPSVLIEEGSALRAFYDANVPVDEEYGDGVLYPRTDEERVHFEPDWVDGIRFLCIQRGHAFALVRLPAGPAADAIYAPLIDEVRASLEESE